MATRFVYLLTEDGATEMCESEYNRLNNLYQRCTERMMIAKINWTLCTGDRDCDYWYSEYERMLKIGGEARRERDWWWERSKDWGVLPF